MPFGTIFCGTKALEQVSERLAKLLPEAIATALDVPGVAHARLSPEDVEVAIVPWNGITNGYDVLITVDANWFLEREKNLASRRQEIAVKLAFLRITCGLKAGLWVRLHKASWQDI